MGQILKEAFEKRMGRQDHESFMLVVEAFFEELEKDALIEKVAETMALIARRGNEKDELNEDSNEMIKLRHYLYRSEPDDLDFSAIVRQCDTVQAKYRFAV